MRRIMIIGAPGSGKSTLARHMGDRLGLPVYHMDRIHWKPGWVERDAQDKMDMVREIVARDEWVFEGGHSASTTLRLARADMLIWLDLPVALRSWRVVRRTVRGRGAVRPDMQDDCPELIGRLPEFMRFIWSSNARSRTRSRLVFEKSTIPRRRFRRPQDVRTYLERLT